MMPASLRAKRHRRRARRLAAEFVGATGLRTLVLGWLFARLPQALIRRAWRAWRDRLEERASNTSAGRAT